MDSNKRKERSRRSPCGLDIAPITQAVRSVLAASALVVATAPVAWAGECSGVDAEGVIRCDGAFTDTLSFSDADLTLIVGGELASNVTPAAGAAGIFAGWPGVISLHNSATIVAVNAYSIQADGSGATLQLDNTGPVSSSNDGSDSANTAAIAIYANDPVGQVDIDNDGDLIAESVSGLADGIFASGQQVVVDNSGSIHTTGYSWAAGIEAGSDDGSVSVVNDGTIDVALSGDVYALGNYAQGSGIVVTGGSEATVTTGASSGISVANAVYGIGISAVSHGDTDVGNAGTISVGQGSLYATGIHAVASAEGGSVSVDNSGGIEAVASWLAKGVEALGAGVGTQASINNSGQVAAIGYSGAIGLFASGDGGAVLSNSGSVQAQSDGSSAYALQAISQGGDISISNSGSTLSTAKYDSVGLSANAGYGSASVVNSGDIAAYATGLIYASATGIHVDAGIASTVTNSGSIVVDGKYGYGVLAQSNGDAQVDNNGSIVSSGDLVDFGIVAQSRDLGSVSVSNSGDISAYSYSGSAYGVFARVLSAEAGAVGGTVEVTNSGSIDVAAYGYATGIFAQATTGQVTVSNSGTITADSANGVAYGIIASGATVTVANSGSITASGATAVAVNLSGTNNTLLNSGTLSASASGGSSLAVLGGDGENRIVNSGVVQGAIVTGAGSDSVENSGQWTISGALSDFGGGDDSFANAAAGRLTLADGSLSLGSGQNTFSNLGTITVSGDNSLDLGSDVAVSANSNLSPATVFAAADTSTSGGSLNNDGVISFIDGSPDDRLTIHGDLGGSGSLNLDVSTLQGLSDQIYVDGNIVGGTSQTINVSLQDGWKTSAALSANPVDFASVSGTVTANEFIGRVANSTSPGDFLSFGVLIGSRAGASGTTLLTLQPIASGLNDTGALAASIAPGVNSLLTAQVGTLRQRMGVLPPSRGDTGISPFVRVFSDSGDVSPSHHAANFGQGGNFNFHQSNRGTEAGLDMGVTPQLNVGLTLAKSKGNQHLKTGYGRDRIDGDTFGLYATWISPSGFYLDTSYRLMRFQTRLNSAAGLQHSSDGDASALNLEGGYAFVLDNGTTIEPQLQYTWTRVKEVSLSSDTAVFRSEAADWQRARLGLQISRALQRANGATWTPYAAASVVHVADGTARYRINDDFVGQVDSDGSSALVELGLALRKAGFSTSIGAHWSNGGSLDGFFGGQAVLRYDW